MSDGHFEQTTDNSVSTMMILAPAESWQKYWYSARCTQCGESYKSSMAMDVKRMVRNCCTGAE